MKKFVLFLAAGAFIVSYGHAQSSGNYRYGEYSGLYYSPIISGPNGFRTVDEENRLMAETLAELKRQRLQDEATQEEIARAVKKRDEEVAAQKRMFGQGKKEEPRPKK